MANPLELSTALDRPDNRERGAFVFVAERLWLDFVNSENAVRGSDSLHDFERFVRWLEAAELLDGERVASMRRRAQQQPAGALAVMGDARRVRTVLRALAERGDAMHEIRSEALAEINRVLGRSAGTRRLELQGDGTFVRTFVPVGDAFAGLLIPIVESAADALILGELRRVRRCADPRCARVFQERRTAGAAGATWRHAAIALRLRGTG